MNIGSMFCEDFQCTGEHNKLCVRRIMGVVGFIAFASCVVFGAVSSELGLLGVLSTGLLGSTVVDKFSGGKAP